MASEIQNPVDTSSEPQHPAVSEKTSPPIVQPTTAAPGFAIPATIDTPTPAPATSLPTASDHPLSPALKELSTHLPALISSTGHSEVWGVELSDTDPSTSIPTQIVLQKYLNANDQDVEKAKDQLTKTLEWRKEMKPLDLVKARHSKGKFEGLGFVTVYEGGDGEKKGANEVFTWNIYGSTPTSIEHTFSSLPDFLAWRVALMELALSSLSLNTATTPITATEDPYKITQVHDYKGISFLRQSPAVKEASKKTIDVFAMAYPELLKEKFFVNVPAVMGFIYGMIKLFVAEKTRRKFHPMSNGGALAEEFPAVPGLGKQLPVVYGGQGKELKEVGRGPELE